MMILICVWLKKVIPCLVIPLEHIFNISLQTGVLQDGMKIAFIQELQY